MFAVLQTDITTCSNNSILLSDSEEEDFQPSKKKWKKEHKIDTVLHGISDIQSNISEIMALTVNSNIPLGLRQIVRDTFKCRICHIVPIKPPVIVTKCCKTVLGCEACVNNWFSGTDALTKSCPVCRVDRGYNETMLLRGLDEFLTKIRQVVQTNNEREEEEELP